MTSSVETVYAYKVMYIILTVGQSMANFLDDNKSVEIHAYTQIKCIFLWFGFNCNKLTVIVIYLFYNIANILYYYWALVILLILYFLLQNPQNNTTSCNIVC